MRIQVRVQNNLLIMKRLFAIVVALVLFSGGMLVGVRFWPPSWLPLESPATPDRRMAEATGERKPLFYRHPMNPTITSPVPAKDDMGMDYIPVYEDEGEAEEEVGLVKISPVMVNNLGVRTEPVTRTTLARRIETVGYIDYDERLISHVHLRTEGWIENLRIKTLGEPVRKGDLLFQVYSRELVSAQEEYLQVIQMGNHTLLAAARNRLRALGIPEDLIEGLGKDYRTRQLSPVYARQDGVVAELDIREGMYVRPDTRVMTLADLSSVWMLGEVFEGQADWVAIGQKAEMRLPYLPAAVWEGEVEYIYPALDLKTRTLKIRLRFDNPEERLKPNMYASVTIHASPKEDVLSIPQQALIRTGDSQRVIVARGEGRFEAVEVKAGIESGERIEIRSGLEEGDAVVVSAQFLIDSEASLKASLQRMTEPKAEEPAEAAAIWSEGVVNAVQSEPPKLNLSHEPIPEIGWPAMTMDFQVADTVPLDELKPGMPVRFGLHEEEGGNYVITAITPLGSGEKP